MENMFLKAMSQSATLTENGSKAFNSTGSNLLDQFGLAGNYRARDYQTVCYEQSLIWDENPELAMRFIFYLRMITRKTKINSAFITDFVQKGQGARDESFKRLLWVAEKHQDVFNENIWLLPIVGSWKDIWTLMFMDSELGINAVNHEIMFTLMAQGMKTDTNLDLIKKFMPRIKSSKKCTTAWTSATNVLAKEFANFMGWTYAEYNKFKSTGKAHEFQRIICSKQYDKINWNLIPGRALTIIANGKTLPKHNLVDTFVKWLDAQPTAKFTGYVYELADKYISESNGGYMKLPFYKSALFNKQFNGLIETAKDSNGAISGNVWTCIDTSGSMRSITDCGVSAYVVCIALGVFFATLNQGAFHKNVVMFDSISRTMQLTGDFCDMVREIVRSNTAWGNTNFDSVVNEMVRIRRNNPEIPLSDYPTTLLVVSDMQFDGTSDESNYEYAKRTLMEVFPKEFVDSMKFVWWNCISRVKTMPATMDDGGVYFFSGFDGSIISMLLGGEVKNEKGEVVEKPSAEDMLRTALSQEILQQVVVK